MPLDILPLGTFNHFARDLRLPLDLADAARVVAKDRVRRVDVGAVDGRVFVDNVSLGIYPHLAVERRRERRRGEPNSCNLLSIERGRLSCVVQACQGRRVATAAVSDYAVIGGRWTQR